MNAINIFIIIILNIINKIDSLIPQKDEIIRYLYNLNINETKYVSFDIDKYFIEKEEYHNLLTHIDCDFFVNSGFERNYNLNIKEMGCVIKIFIFDLINENYNMDDIVKKLFEYTQELYQCLYSSIILFGIKNLCEAFEKVGKSLDEIMKIQYLNKKIFYNSKEAITCRILFDNFKNNNSIFSYKKFNKIKDNIFIDIFFKNMNLFDTLKSLHKFKINNFNIIKQISNICLERNIYLVPYRVYKKNKNMFQKYKNKIFIDCEYVNSESMKQLCDICILTFGYLSKKNKKKFYSYISKKYKNYNRSIDNKFISISFNKKCRCSFCNPDINWIYNDFNFYDNNEYNENINIYEDIKSRHPKKNCKYKTKDFS